jgi:hypothetical protein
MPLVIIYLDLDLDLALGSSSSSRSKCSSSSSSSLDLKKEVPIARQVSTIRAVSCIINSRRVYTSLILN